VTVLLIEHHMDVIVGISDRMMAIASGKMVAVGSPSEVMNDERVITAYLGGAHAVG
jgi:branched-chain amino acid transport system ATP-binding protein